MKRPERSSENHAAINPMLVMVASILALLDAAAAAERWIALPRPAVVPLVTETVKPAERCGSASPEELRDMMGRD